MDIEMIQKLLQLGGMTSLAGFALSWAWYERRQNRENQDKHAAEMRDIQDKHAAEARELQDKLRDLATAQVTAVVKAEAAIDALTDAINRLDQHRS